MKNKVVNIKIEELLKLLAERATSKVLELKDHKGFIDIDFSFDIDKESCDIRDISVSLTWEEESKQ